MSENRGQYAWAPLHNMKDKRKHSDAPEAEGEMRRFGFLGFLMTLGLPALFLAALLIQSQLLRYIFLGAALVSVLVMWGLNAFVRSARSTLTLVYLSLAVVIAIALFMSIPASQVQTVSDRIRHQEQLFSAGHDQPVVGTEVPQESPAPSEASGNSNMSAAQIKMVQFLEYWRINSIPGMITLCSPAWVAQYESPETALFQLISGVRPESYEFESISGSDNDTSRTVTIKVLLDAKNGTEPTLNRLQVLMFRVNNEWYIDPQSLKGTPINAEAEAARQQRAVLSSTIVPTATPDPQVEANRFYVYYNKEGKGKLYHADKICDGVSQKYWPMTPLDFSLINSQQYKNQIGRAHV